MDELLILSMVLIVALSVMGLRFRSTPILVVSSLGWVLVSFRLYELYALDAMLPMAMLWTIAFAQVLLGARS